MQRIERENSGRPPPLSLSLSLSQAVSAGQWRDCKAEAFYFFCKKGDGKTGRCPAALDCSSIEPGALGLSPVSESMRGSPGHGLCMGGRARSRHSARYWHGVSQWHVVGSVVLPLHSTAKNTVLLVRVQLELQNPSVHALHVTFFGTGLHAKMWENKLKALLHRVHLATEPPRSFYF
jgi:hypothetical protein